MGEQTPRESDSPLRIATSLEEMAVLMSEALLRQWEETDERLLRERGIDLRPGRARIRP